MKIFQNPAILLLLVCGLTMAQEPEENITEFFSEDSINLKHIVLTPEVQDQDSAADKAGIPEQLQLQQAFNNNEDSETLVRTVDDFSFKVNRNGKIISLTPATTEIPEISINLNRNKVTIDGKTLKFDKKLTALDSQNIFNSPWKAYRWKKDRSKIMIGRLEKDGRVFIQLRNIAGNGKKELILVE